MRVVRVLLFERTCILPCRRLQGAPRLLLQSYIDNNFRDNNIYKREREKQQQQHNVREASAPFDDDDDGYLLQAHQNS